MLLAFLSWRASAGEESCAATAHVPSAIEQWAALFQAEADRIGSCLPTNPDEAVVRYVAARRERGVALLLDAVRLLVVGGYGAGAPFEAAVGVLAEARGLADVASLRHVGRGICEPDLEDFAVACIRKRQAEAVNAWVLVGEGSSAVQFITDRDIATVVALGRDRVEAILAGGGVA